MNEFLEKTIKEIIQTGNGERVVNELNNLSRLEAWEIITSALLDVREKTIEAIKNGSLKKDVNLDFLIAYVSAIDYLRSLPENIIKIIELQSIDKRSE
ncbi:MAG: hypothetical protein N3D20_02810 [Candidatus Pacearchaeota archaeon]|nr:hypothetical protein [Candidatus Pacearchaeota archaeon]